MQKSWSWLGNISIIAHPLSNLLSGLNSLGEVNNTRCIIFKLIIEYNSWGTCCKIADGQEDGISQIVSISSNIWVNGTRISKRTDGDIDWEIKSQHRQYYFRQGQRLCNNRRWLLCLSFCLSVCLSLSTYIEKVSTDFDEKSGIGWKWCKRQFCSRYTPIKK